MEDTSITETDSWLSRTSRGDNRPTAEDSNGLTGATGQPVTFSILPRLTGR